MRVAGNWRDIGAEGFVVSFGTLRFSVWVRKLAL
jgi:hypothetical protein